MVIVRQWVKWRSRLGMSGHAFSRSFGPLPFDRRRARGRRALNLVLNQEGPTYCLKAVYQADGAQVTFGWRVGRTVDEEDLGRVAFNGT